MSDRLEVAFDKFVADRNGLAENERTAFMGAARILLRAQALHHDSAAEDVSSQVAAAAEEAEQARATVSLLRAELAKARQEREELADRNVELAAELARRRGPAPVVSAPDGLPTTSGWLLPGMQAAVSLAMAEVVAARAKHAGRTLESTAWNDDRRYRVLGEEVGEVAEAIDLVEVAALAATRPPSSPDDEDGSWSVCDAEQHLTDELVQVAGTALRWVAHRIGVNDV